MDKRVETYKNRLEQRKNEAEAAFVEARREAGSIVLRAEADRWNERSTAELMTAINKMNDTASRYHEVRHQMAEFDLFVINGQK